MKNLFTNSRTRWLGIVICTCMLLTWNAHAYADDYIVLTQSKISSSVLSTSPSFSNTPQLKTNNATVATTADLTLNGLGSQGALYYNSTSLTHANLTNTSNYQSGSNASITLHGFKFTKGSSGYISFTAGKFSSAAVIYRFNNTDSNNYLTIANSAKTKRTDGNVYKEDISIHADSTRLTIKNTGQKDACIIVILTEAPSTYGIARDANSWNASSELMSGSGTVSKTLTLDADTDYEFKVVNTSGNTWYGNGETWGGTKTQSVSSTGTNNNCHLLTTESGDYVFTFNTSTKDLTITYPNSYTYYYANTDSWSKVCVYKYSVISGTTYKEANWPGTEIASPSFTCGGVDYYEASSSGYKTIIFNNGVNGGSSEKKTGNMTVSSSDEGKYVGGTGSSWSAMPTYTVTYNKNGDGAGGAGSVTGSVPTDSNSPYSCGSDVTVEGKGNLALAGYNFIGWNTQANGEGSDYSAGGTISGISSNTILYAQWEVIPEYSVTYNANGASGSVPTDASTYLNGATVTVLGKNTLTYTNKVFAGWNTADDGSGTWYDPSATFSMGSADVTLYAQWATCVSTLDFASYSAAMKTRTPENTQSDLTSRNVLHSLGGYTCYDNSDSDDGYHGLKFKNSGDWIGIGVAAGNTVTIDFETVGTSPNFYIDFSKQDGKTASTGGTVEFTSAGSDRYFKIKAADGKSTVVKKITITPECYDAELAYGTGTVTKVYGDDNFTNSLTNSHSVSVTYSSNNTSVATVDENGEVTIKAAGTATITATSAEQTISSTKYCADAVSYTLNVGPAVTVGPTDVEGNYGYRYTIGETIDLTATPSGGSSYTYQWQKYKNSAWVDIANGEDATDGGTFSGVTTARLQISGCTASNAGSYRCNVTAAGQTNADAGYRVRIYTFNGKYYGGGATGYAITWTGAQTGTVTLNLTAKSVYQFKVTDNDGKWYGSGKDNYIIQPVSMDCGTTEGNVDVRLLTAPAGDYTFTIDITHAQDGASAFVNVRTAYPSVTHPNEGYVYLTKYAWRPYLHYWFDSKTILTDASADPQLGEDQYTTICGNDYWCIPVINQYCNFIARDNPTSPTNTTGDQHSNEDHPGQNIYNDGTWKWRSLTRTISFNSNYGSGTTASITHICPGSNATAPDNGFTRAGWTFVGWCSNKYGKGKKIYQPGDEISAITSDSTLYAQWERTIYFYSNVADWYNLDAKTQLHYWDGSATSNEVYVTMTQANTCASPTIYKATIRGGGYNKLQFKRLKSDESVTWNETVDLDFNDTYSVFKLTAITGYGDASKKGTGVFDSNYSAPTFTIRYAGGEDAEEGSRDDETKTCDVDFTLPSSAVFTRTGYTQTGWALTENGSQSHALGGNYITNADQTFYPVWTIDTHTVTYNANGGSGTTADGSSPYDYGSTVTTISNSFTNSGYKFKWWNTASNGSGEDFYVGEQFTIEEDADLYAQWESVGTGEEFWCGVPDEWHATTHDVTVGDMKITAKDYSSPNNYINKAMGKDKEYTVVSATNKHATVIAAAGDNYYIQVCFSDGSPINELNLGVTTSETTDQNIVVCYSTTADFSTGQYEFVKVGSTDNVVSVPGHDQSTKSVTNVSPSTENKYKYVRIYRKLTDGTDYNRTGAALGSSAKARIYSIKAKKGSAGYALTNAGPDNGAIAITSDGSSAITESEAGETVYITATPSTGYSFSAWDIYKTDASGTKVTPAASTASTSFTMPSYAVTVNATFAAINYAITHNAAENGTYTISVAGGAATSESTTANYGQTITLAATPSSHYKLQAWNVTKMSSEDAVSMATANTFVMPAEAVTIAPTFGRVYTVSFYTHGGSSQASIEQSSVGGAITMPAAPTYAGHEFVNWVIGGETFDPGDAYTPTANITAHATWKANCAGGGGSEPVVLFSQNFNSAAEVAYDGGAGLSYSTANTLTNLVGSGSNLFTSITSVSGQTSSGIAINSSTGVGDIDDATGLFLVRKKNSAYYWSMTRTADFAATAPTAIAVEMDIYFDNLSSGTSQGVTFAIGDGFEDGLKGNTIPSSSNVHSGFNIMDNSSPKFCQYGSTTTIYSTAITEATWYSIVWVINNTGSTLTYEDPDGSGTSTVNNDCFDIWLKTQAQEKSSFTRIVNNQAATTGSKDLQNIHIGGHGDKLHLLMLDNIVVTDIASAGGSSCYYITYDGNGADAGSVNDDRAYSSGDNVYVSTCDLSSNFTREGYEFNGWNNKPDGSGTYYNYGTNSNKVVITKDTTLYAQWKIVVDEDNENLSGFDTPQYKDVVVRNGAKLTITQTMSVRNITVESGSTLHVAKNGEEGITLSIDSLSLVGGYYEKPDHSTVYDMPRVYIDPLSTLSRTNSTINFDIAVTNNFHPIAVPFPVKVSDVKYADPAVNDAYYLTHYIIKTYDGAARANGSYSCWTPVDRLELNEETKEYEDVYLQPGRGYILAALRRVGKLYEFIRFPMKNVPSAWTTLGEQGTVDDVTKNVVAVEAYLKDGDTDGSKTPNANKGWNILGVPFMSRYQATDDIIQSPTEIIQGHFDYSTNKWDNDEIRYVTVPTYDFSEYNQYSIEDEDTKLLPGWCFFVQIETSGNLKFLSASEAENEAMPIYAPKREQERKPTVKTGIILTGANAKDKTTIIVSDKYNAAEYEINADLEKMFGENGYTLATYTLSGETRLAYNAMNNADIMDVIPVGYRAPEEGEYTFSINPRYAESEAFEQVNLIDYEEGVITNLLHSSYSFTTARTQNDARFAINVVKRQDMPTDVENVQGGDAQNGKVRKVLINDKMYIILDGKMYDATGKSIK